MTDPNGLIRSGRPAPGRTLPATRGTVAGNHPSAADVDPGADGILDARERLAADRRVTAG
ncbi:hypothetical protein DKT69_34955 [Micromonospora sicca]|jgi:hypothetical protein|uniref:Uncharacterized protein n=1 Tax=Micromonospora sicca TaxID=2202420 RepID=A0A317CYT2_9ACTN|nr:hypothetical protein [Micromonospora sp. 4G51]PWR07352.1 hypothetical protein DKT69_34955 [Micromonospora sp. 4G51]